MSTQIVRLVWADFNSRIVNHTMRVSDALTPTSSSLLAALAGAQSLSRASLSLPSLVVPRAYTDAGSPSGTQEGSRTYAVLLFSVPTAPSDEHWSFFFSDPDPSCFDSDGFVDPASSLIAPIISAIPSVVTDSSGRALGSFIVGWRSSALWEAGL